MRTHPYAGKSAPKELLIDVGRLEAEFYEGKPDPSDPNKLVSFGRSGHRGTSSNETSHILAVTEAICEYRRNRGITGPLFIGKETHVISHSISVSGWFAARPSGTENIYRTLRL
jgi:phosphoglucomutase